MVSLGLCDNGTSHNIEKQNPYILAAYLQMIYHTKK